MPAQTENWESNDGWKRGAGEPKLHLAHKLALRNKRENTKTVKNAQKKVVRSIEKRIQKGTVKWQM